MCSPNLASPLWASQCHPGSDWAGTAHSRHCGLVEWSELRVGVLPSLSVSLQGHPDWLCYLSCVLLCKLLGNRLPRYLADCVLGSPIEMNSKYRCTSTEVRGVCNRGAGRMICSKQFVRVFNLIFVFMLILRQHLLTHIVTLTS